MGQERGMRVAQGDNSTRTLLNKAGAPQIRRDVALPCVAPGWGMLG